MLRIAGPCAPVGVVARSGTYAREEVARPMRRGSSSGGECSPAAGLMRMHARHASDENDAVNTCRPVKRRSFASRGEQSSQRPVRDE
jgi:hypothetical protein